MSLIQAIKTQIQSLIDRANEKTGKTDADLTSAVNSLIESGGGDSSQIDALIDGSIIEITSSVTKIRNFIFGECYDLTTINLPNVKTIGVESFYSCNNLITINIPNTLQIGEKSFYGCTNLEQLNLPVVLEIRKQAFGSCRSLITVDAPNLHTIGQEAFYACHALTSLNIPYLEYIGENVFSNCESLVMLDLPAAINIGEQAFVFSSLKTLLLRSKTMCDMAISAIVSTNIISIEGMPTGEGFIYVPTSLYESYIADFTPKIVEFATSGGVPMDEPTATYLASSILRKLEDYTVDGTTTGELDETKI